MKFVGSLLVALLAGAANAQIARFQFTSDPGEWIGQGQTKNVFYVNGVSTFFGTLSQLGSSGPDYFTFVGSNQDQDDFVLIQLGTDQLEQPLAVGIYEGAERAAFAGAGKPGLDVSFQSRGTNRLAGRFEIHDLSYRNTGVDEWTLDRLHFTFEQVAEESPGQYLRGSFTYEAVPEPATFAALGAGLLAVRSRRQRVQTKAK